MDSDEVRRQTVAEELLEAVRHRLRMIAEHDAAPSDESRRRLRVANERLERAERAAAAELAGRPRARR